MAFERDMTVLQRLKRAALEKTAMDPGLSRALLAGGIGALGAGVPIALLMHAHEEAARQRARNVGFGAGVATGLAAPGVLGGLHNLLGGTQ